MEDISELFEELMQESDEIIFKKIKIDADIAEFQVPGEGLDNLPADILSSLFLNQKKSKLK